ncbi:MAG: ankyrin repeat domain-containing protein [Myxococcales bacterium]|nr:ankyrin repeat domain-containing protein [Myxococcales bacterium]
MSAIAESLEPAPSQALALAESLEADLLAADTTDPIELGWARDYRVRALYRLGRHQEGLVLVIAPPPRAMAISARNAAWLRSVAAEMALHAGARERIRPLIREALHLRLEDGDQGGVRMAVETGVALLQRAERPTEVEAWLDEVEARASAAEPGSVAAMALSSALSAIARAPGTPRSCRARPAARASIASTPPPRPAISRASAAPSRRGVDPGERHLGWPGLPTPLIAAAFAGHRACVDALIAAGAPLDAVNVQGRSALHLAADQGHGEVVAAPLRRRGPPSTARTSTATPPSTWPPGKITRARSRPSAPPGPRPRAPRRQRRHPARGRRDRAGAGDHPRAPGRGRGDRGDQRPRADADRPGGDGGASGDRRDPPRGRRRSPGPRPQRLPRAREWAEAQGFDAVLIALESTASERRGLVPRPGGGGTSRRRRD